ncbi:MAG: hypothetical protein CMJ39_00125 [Phycisphaerae bacterium]|nr:hypothetical protein [Phycisphaerae bacterium]|tara:strand:- start:534 stop:1040 length:507 start_codon:yes stop_codon:yes gene_type:complete
MALRNPIVLINGQLQELPGFDRIRNSGNIKRQVAPPTDNVDGDLWFDLGNNLLKIWSGTGFTTVGGGGGGGGAAVSVSPTEPASPGNGSLWYDTSEGFLKVYLAATVEWVPCEAKFFVQDNAPGTGVEQADIWYSPLLNVFSMYIAGSTNAWIPMGSQLSVSDILAFG